MLGKLICKLRGHHGLCIWGNGYYCCHTCGEKNYKTNPEQEGLLCKLFGHNVMSCYDDFAYCTKCQKTWDLCKGVVHVETWKRGRVV